MLLFIPLDLAHIAKAQYNIYGWQGCPSITYIHLKNPIFKFQFPNYNNTM